jgi:REP element-mobilizing transposase RayT
MGGIARAERIKPIAIGGTANHSHLLLEIPPSISIANAMRIIKSVSSKWVNENGDRRFRFAWQRGMGPSVSTAVKWVH